MAKAGRPRKNLDLNKARKLASQFCTGEEIAAALGMSYDTLLLRLKDAGFSDFTDWYKKENGVGRASLRSLQWAKAKSGNPTMQIWLGKQYLNQRDQNNTTTLSDLTLNIKVGHEDDGKSEPDAPAADTATAKDSKL